MWAVYATLSAIFAALVAVFAKLGLEKIDSTLATTVRSIIMAAFLVMVSLLLGKFAGFTINSFSGREWGLIILAGVAGAISWLFYFLALKSGIASEVVAIDKLSIVLVVVLAALFLGEGWQASAVLGAVLMVVGAILIAMK